MKNLTESVSAATSELSELESRRESAIACSRRIIRQTKVVIHGIHTGSDVTGEMERLNGQMSDMLDLCRDPLILCSGPVQDAMGEYAEAVILNAVMSGDSIPGHDELRIPASAWILGLADCEGELRRVVMTRLMDGDLEGARDVFSELESIHEQVMLLDVPDAVAPVRRKQDIARGIMDKTRSDMTTASIMHR
ncbi:MAG: RNA-binding protein [Candidatus Methanomethylophilaceae archaeon]|nr:RNA-binding protein [Candidatus Methanomethylophilaceae archaeon]